MNNTDDLDSFPEGANYWCFISYCHTDNKGRNRTWANWLHQELERYEIPVELIGTENKRGEIIPDKIYPIFRDEESLPANSNLQQSIEDALDSSRYMVVLCSPQAVESRYVDQEISYFKGLGRGDRIIPAILAGKPNSASDLECFPLSLRSSEIERNRIVEPLAADFRIDESGAEAYTSASAYEIALTRESTHSRKLIQRKAEALETRLQLMKLKIIAGILGVRLEELQNRDRIFQLEQARKRARFMRIVIVVVSLAALTASGAGVLAWFQKQAAERARIDAEDLVEFLSVELYDDLRSYVPVDTHKTVRNRIDEYYSRQDQRLPGRASALTRIAHISNKGDIARADGELENARLLYEEALNLLKVHISKDSWNENALLRRAIILERLGITEMRIENVQNAENWFLSLIETSVELSEFDKDKSNEFKNTSLGNLVELHFLYSGDKKKYERYLADWDRFTKILVENDPTYAEIKSRVYAAARKSISLYEFDRYTDAIRYAEEARELSERLFSDGEKLEYFEAGAYAHEARAVILLAMNEVRQAIISYEIAVRLRRKNVNLDALNVNHRKGFSKALMNLARSYSQAGDREKADDSFSEGDGEYSRLLGLKQFKDDTLIRLDYALFCYVWGVHLQGADTDKSKELFQKAIRLNNLRDPSERSLNGLAMSLTKLAGVQFSSSNTEEAALRYKDALKAFDDLERSRGHLTPDERTNLALCNMTLGMALVLLDESHETETHFARSYEILKQLRAENPESEEIEGRYNTAEKALREWRKVLDREK